MLSKRDPLLERPSDKLSGKDVRKKPTLGFSFFVFFVLTVILLILHHGHLSINAQLNKQINKAHMYWMFFL